MHRFLALLRMTGVLSMTGVLALATAALPARAEMQGQVGYGQRQVDFHRFTDAQGEGKSTGHDLGAALYFGPQKAAWGLGAFYSEQFYNTDPERYYFESVRVREFGLGGLIKLADKGFAPEIAFGYTLAGSLTGKTLNPKLLEKSQGGAVPTAGESTWTYSLQGMHVRPGMSVEIGRGGVLTVGFDVSRQTAKLKTVSNRTVDETDTYADYAKTTTTFNSYAVILGMRAER